MLQIYVYIVQTHVDQHYQPHQFLLDVLLIWLKHLLLFFYVVRSFVIAWRALADSTVESPLA
jgi:hypothetical protein